MAGTRFAMGVQLNYRKIASGATLPSQIERYKLYGKLANWFPMLDVTILAGLTAQSDFTAQGTLHILALLGSVTTTGGVVQNKGACTVQFYDAGKQILFSSQPLNFENQLGNAQHPFWLRSPYVMAPNTHIKVQVQNLMSNSVPVQVTAFGYQD